ncbi:hypothetical protein AAWM_01090 [Aspergillus awamori]|uniref:Uncharacterized protein n=1 Tax=Aspergillus awamori TaxID=105351 RepID=A0A401KGA8_ASPAW|nr:hypothetical protein AAWM_01090 [Aspergillus awamori]
MARPGCREKLTEGPRAIAKVWSCTDASPVLVDGPPKEPLPANDNPGWSVDCRIIRPDDDGLQRSSWKLGLARPCYLRPSRAYCLGGRGGEFCFTLLLGASRAASLQGVQTPERLVGGTMGNELAPQEPVKSFLFSPFEENINRDRKRDVLCHDKKNHKFTLETRTRNCLRLDQFGANLGKAVFP